MISQKVQLIDVKKMIDATDKKFEDEFNLIHDKLHRKASNEDLQYYKRDQ